ncbi:MAG: SRPBCC family protein [Nocardioidaceae bacterium]
MRARLRDEVVVEVPAVRLWDVVTDWSRQGEWIPFTRVRTVSGDARGVGGRIEAWTGVGPVGFLDPMVVTVWDAPRRCEVLHTGRVLRGEGGFEVDRVDATRSMFVWWESLELPLGSAGMLGWRLVAPVWQVGVDRALDRLRALAEAHPESAGNY